LFIIIAATKTTATNATITMAAIHPLFRPCSVAGAVVADGGVVGAAAVAPAGVLFGTAGLAVEVAVADAVAEGVAEAVRVAVGLAVAVAVGVAVGVWAWTKAGSAAAISTRARKP